MVEHQVRRPWSDSLRHPVRVGSREPPGRREFRREKYGAVQFDATQDFGESIHSWTPRKLSRRRGKSIARTGLPGKSTGLPDMVVRTAPLHNCSPEGHAPL